MPFPLNYFSIHAERVLCLSSFCSFDPQALTLSPRAETESHHSQSVMCHWNYCSTGMEPVSHSQVHRSRTVLFICLPWTHVPTELL